MFHRSPTDETRAKHWTNHRSGHQRPRQLSRRRRPPASVPEADSGRADLGVLGRSGLRTCSARDHPRIKVGGRGQWRTETCELECAIEEMYRDTAQFIADHPFGNSTGDDDPELD